MTTIIDLSRLPPPAIVEALDYEAILAAMKADLKARHPAWTADLESDPVNKVLEAASYRELVLRQRVNDAARANLLAFAAGSDLDHLSAFYGVTRLPEETVAEFERRVLRVHGFARRNGETDAAFLARMARDHGLARLAAETDAALRSRVQQRIQGWANAGGSAHYRYWALTADPAVKDAAVSSPAPGVVRIAVLSRTGDGTPDADLMDAVHAQVMRDDVRVLTDRVELVPARIVPVTVSARLWLLPQTPAEVYAEVAGGFPAALEAARGLGWDLTRSWIVARLHAAGVHSVVLDSPAEDVLCGPADCVALGPLAIMLEGRKE